MRTMKSLVWIQPAGTVALIWALSFNIVKIICGCVSVPPSNVTVNIISATVDSGGFCWVKLDVTNSSSRDFPLLSYQGVYPELDVRVYVEGLNTEKIMTISGLNCIRELSCAAVVPIKPFTTVQLPISFDLQNFDKREHLMICVASPVNRAQRVQAPVVNISSSSVGKGCTPYPRLKDEDIQRYKAVLW